MLAGNGTWSMFMQTVVSLALTTLPTRSQQVRAFAVQRLWAVQLSFLCAGVHPINSLLSSFHSSPRCETFELLAEASPTFPNVLLRVRNTITLIAIPIVVLALQVLGLGSVGYPPSRYGVAIGGIHCGSVVAGVFWQFRCAYESPVHCLSSDQPVGLCCLQSFGAVAVLLGSESDCERCEHHSARPDHSPSLSGQHNAVLHRGAACWFGVGAAGVEHQ